MPVQRSGSSKKPARTWVTTATTGAEKSGWTRRVRPLGSTSRWRPAGQTGGRGGKRGPLPPGPSLQNPEHARLGAAPDECLRVGGGNDDAGLRLPTAGQAVHEIVERAVGPFPVRGLHLQQDLVPAPPDRRARQGHYLVRFPQCRL